MKLDVLVAMLAYGGNGGVATILPDIGLWLMKLQTQLNSDDRIGRVGIQRFGDIPLTMERNRIVKTAKEANYDVVLMLDSDNVPDLYLDRRPWAKPFWNTSFDFLYERASKGLPSVVAAPYCGPPPHPTGGGYENVYVFKAEGNETGNPEAGFRFEAYDRNTAAQMRGIQEIAAGPTGCIIYTTDSFDLLPIGDLTQAEILDAYRDGRMDQQRALRLLNMQSWFFYEFTDRWQTQKASTEDVTNTREIQLAGINKHGEPVVFCNWDAWAGHYKPKCVGMPEPIKMEQVNEIYREAVQSNLSNYESIQDLDFSDFHKRNIEAGSFVNNLDDEAEEEKPDKPAGAKDPNLAGGHQIVPRMIYGRKVTSVGHVTSESDLAAWHWLVAQQAKAKPEKHLRVVEIGSWVGESAIALQSGFGPAGGTVFCVDTWQGTPSDSTSSIVKCIGSDELFNYFLQNVGDLIDSSIKVIRGDSLSVAEQLSEQGPQDADLVMIDANHDEDWVALDLEAWFPHVAEDGILCGHDWTDTFPGVIKAVTDFCKQFGLEPKVVPDTCVWYIEKAEILESMASKSDDGESAQQWDTGEEFDTPS